MDDWGGGFNKFLMAMPQFAYALLLLISLLSITYSHDMTHMHQSTVLYEKSTNL